MKTYTLTSEQQDSLEKMIDNTSLQAVIEALSNICYLKAEHINHNWQDEPLALAWECAASKLSFDAGNPFITDVSRWGAK